jgi:hypothetical protein
VQSCAKCDPPLSDLSSRFICLSRCLRFTAGAQVLGP